MNHIIFCINDNWAMPAGVLIKSILNYNHNLDITFHIISKDFSDLSKSKLNEIISNNTNIQIEYYKVDNETFNTLRITKNDHVTIETYYRFLIPQLLPQSIEKALYLDCDILCTGNLTSLFNLDISNYSAAMSIDTRNNKPEVFSRLSYPSEYGYRCAGVMLLNLSYWRKNNCAQDCINFLIDNSDLCIWHDQDAINKVLHASIKNLDSCYDVLPGFFTVYDFLDGKITKKNLNKLFINENLWKDLYNSIENPCFIHFGGKIKPWHDYDLVKPYTFLWRYFYSQTPWKNDKLIKYPQNFKAYIKTTIRRFLKIKKLKYPKKAYLREQYYLEKLTYERF